MVNTFDDIRGRYQNDVTFRRLVDMFQAMIGMHTTPSEAREALMLAVYMVEMRNPQPSRLRLQEFCYNLIEDAKDW